MVTSLQKKRKRGGRKTWGVDAASGLYMGSEVHLHVGRAVTWGLPRNIHWLQPLPTLQEVSPALEGHVVAVLVGPEVHI